MPDFNQNSQGHNFGTKTMNLSPKKKYFPQKYHNFSLIGFITALSYCLTSIALAEINTTVLFQPLPESE